MQCSTSALVEDVKDAILEKLHYDKTYDSTQFTLSFGGMVLGADVSLTDAMGASLVSCLIVEILSGKNIGSTRSCYYCSLHEILQ